MRAQLVYIKVLVTSAIYQRISYQNQLGRFRARLGTESDGYFLNYFI